MTMSQANSGALVTSQSETHNNQHGRYSDFFEFLKSSQQVATETPRELTDTEISIIKTINNCFKNWYNPWKKTFLDGGEEFKAVYELMENLMHYDYQVRNSETILSNDRTNAIAQAVARLIDYGNAILGIDLIIRANDETSKELDPSSVTTIELYQAHIRGHKLREKLLYNYFRRDKRNIATASESDLNSQLGSMLQVPLTCSNNPSPTMERSHRLSVGSNTSINTLVPEGGRRTPQSHHIEVKTVQTTNDLNDSQLEMRHMTATIRSSVFLGANNSSIRRALLPGVSAKIESLMTVPTNTEKLTNCFELLDVLLDSIERLPVESRTEEVNIISQSLLRPIVRKVYIDNRDNYVEFQHSHWTTYLLTIIRLMTAADFNSYLKHFPNLTDLSAFLKDYLFIVKRLVTSSERPTNISASIVDPIDSINDLAPIYPDCWIEMILLVCSTFLKSLIHLYQILRQHFSSNLQMWMSFIDCLIHFILQGALKPDRPMFKERQTLLANDLRKTSAEYVWITWDSLNTDQKQSILEDLSEPLLRACITLNSRQRSILLPIFYDMMRCDYTNQYITPRGSMCTSGSISSQSPQSRIDVQVNYIYEEDFENPAQFRMDYQMAPKIDRNSSRESLPYLSFRENSSEDGTVLTKFTHLIVGNLNTLMNEQGLGDAQFKTELCDAISGELNPKYYNQNSYFNSSDFNQFKCMAKHTSDLIAEFIQICLDSRQANKLSYNHLHLLCLFKLILFFRDKVDRIELYLANLHKLWYLHHNTGRYVEAGFTLLEHAKSIPWSNKPLESQYRIITRSFHTPEPLTDYSSLKIFLYTTIIEYFDQGHLWEAAVPLCRELIDMYQFRTFEYAKLAQVFTKLSTYFNNISDGNKRSHPEYFRVTFYGCGFPQCIRDATMVYRGKPYEKLSEFQATILNKYPDAKLLNSLAKPDESILNESDAKYLQINACSPVVDLKSKFNNDIDLTKIEPTILDYYRHNECDKFEFSRRISRPVNIIDVNGTSRTVVSEGNQDNFANMWRERTTLTTNSLPAMLPFFPVYLIETNIVSPIESAIEDLERANDRLSCMVNRFKADKRQEEDVRLLGQLLLGVVDAAVNGGITKYEEAFFNSPPTTTSVHNGDPAATQQEPSSTSEAITSFALESNFAGLTMSTANSRERNNKQSGNNNHNYDQNATTLIDPMRSQHQVVVDRCQQDQIGGTSERHHQPSATQLSKLKCLIAKQVPLLDEAIRLHRDRVADVMRPQHEHLEASYKKLKHHIMSKYYRYLPAEYNRSTIRSYRSLARSPNRSVRSESRVSAALSTTSSPTMLGQISAGSGRVKRMSDASGISNNQQQDNSAPNNIVDIKSTNIPYKQLGRERRSLPFLTGVPGFDRILIKEAATNTISVRADSDRELGCLNDDVECPITPPQFSAQVVSRSRPMSRVSLRRPGGPQAEVQMSDSQYVCVEDLLPSSPDKETPYARLLSNKNLSNRPYNEDDSEDTDASLSSSKQPKTSHDDDETKLVSF